MSIHERIGRNIIRLRKSRGMTQESFALECGISSSYLRMIEHGKANPTINELVRIARILGVRVEALLAEPAAPQVTACALQ